MKRYENPYLEDLLEDDNLEKLKQKFIFDCIDEYQSSHIISIDKKVGRLNIWMSSVILLIAHLKPVLMLELIRNPKDPKN